ncbi:MAG: hypothetical protein HC862_20255 [Scytonema sp. RU_4_4]|nr:hypothetical protein [Scytonema sp. RU_4_4]
MLELAFKESDTQPQGKIPGTLALKAIALQDAERTPKLSILPNILHEGQKPGFLRITLLKKLNFSLRNPVF